MSTHELTHEPALAAPPKLTSAEKKTARLRAAAAKIQAEIDRVTAEHAGPIAVHGQEVAAAIELCERARRALEGPHGIRATIEYRRVAVARFRDTLAATERALAAAEAIEPTAVAALSAAETAARTAATRRDKALNEPNRHLAALAKDLASIERRLQLHQARQPLRALVPR